MAIDVKRLIGDAEAANKAQRQPSASGTYAAIRQALPAIDAMRQNGIGWKAIAAALGQQGITQRRGEVDIPITTSRLTALVSDIRKRTARKQATLTQRALRADLTKTSTKSERSKQFALSDELTVKSADANEPARFKDEETIRRDQLDAIKDLFKDKD